VYKTRVDRSGIPAIKPVVEDQNVVVVQQSGMMWLFQNPLSPAPDNLDGVSVKEIKIHEEAEIVVIPAFRGSYKSF